MESARLSQFWRLLSWTVVLDLYFVLHFFSTLRVCHTIPWVWPPSSDSKTTLLSKKSCILRILVFETLKLGFSLIWRGARLRRPKLPARAFGALETTFSEWIQVWGVWSQKSCILRICYDFCILRILRIPFFCYHCGFVWELFFVFETKFFSITRWRVEELP